MGAVRYLLDTCTFLWLCADPARLSTGARAALAAPEADLLLSDVTVLEITLKWAAGKIRLPEPPRSWIERQSAIWRARAVPLSRAIIYRSSELPRLHADPFDRLLLASALEQEAILVSPDDALRRYPVACLW